MCLDIEPISSYIVWADFRKGTVCTNKLSVCCVLLNQLPLAFCYALLAAFIFEIHCTSEENHVDTWWLVYISPLAATTILESTRETYPLMGMQHNVEPVALSQKRIHHKHKFGSYSCVLMYTCVYLCILMCTYVYTYVYSFVLVYTHEQSTNHISLIKQA